MVSNIYIGITIFLFIGMAIAAFKRWGEGIDSSYGWVGIVYLILGIWGIYIAIV